MKYKRFLGEVEIDSEFYNCVYEDGILEVFVNSREYVDKLMNSKLYKNIEYYYFNVGLDGGKTIVAKCYLQSVSITSNIIKFFVEEIIENVDSKRLEVATVKTLLITGKQINCFFPALGIKNIIEDEKNSNKFDVCEFKVQDKRVKFKLTYREDKNMGEKYHYEASTTFKFEFIDEIKYEEIDYLYYVVINFLKFISNSDIVNIERMHLVLKEENVITRIYKNDRNFEINNEKISCREIAGLYYLQGENVKKILEDISSNKIYMSNIVKSNSYDYGRMIVNFTAFENRFANYIEKIDEKYREKLTNTIRAKEAVIEEIDKLLNLTEYNNRVRSKFKHMKNIINTYDLNIEEKLKFIVVKYKKIFEKIFSCYEITYDDKTIELWAGRLSDLRNVLAHGKEPENYEINIEDIKILEILNYVIILKSYEIEDENMFEIINKFFSIYIH